MFQEKTKVEGSSSQRPGKMRTGLILGAVVVVAAAERCIRLNVLQAVEQLIACEGRAVPHEIMAGQPGFVVGDFFGGGVFEGG